MFETDIYGESQCAFQMPFELQEIMEIFPLRIHLYNHIDIATWILFSLDKTPKYTNACNPEFLLEFQLVLTEIMEDFING